MFLNLELIGGLEKKEIVWMTLCFRQTVKNIFQKKKEKSWGGVKAIVILLTMCEDFKVLINIHLFGSFL